MLFKIYTEKKEKESYFKLLKFHEKIELVAVDEDGFRIGSILSIGSTGLRLSTLINKDIGLPLDSKGSVKLCNY